MTDGLLLLIGPSGSGKSTLAAALEAERIVTVWPTWTTRPRRPDELVAGSPNHRFVDDAAFDAMERDGAFVGVVRLPGLPHRYGLRRPAAPAGSGIPTVVARAAFVAALRAAFPGGRTIQVERPAGAALLALCERATSVEEVGARLRESERERLAGRALADRCFVNDGSPAALVERVGADLVAAAASGMVTA